jgi:hypothetical protein
MLRKVLKRIPKGGGQYLDSGLIVDVSKWRNVKVLEASRFLGKLTAEEEAAYREQAKPKVEVKTEAKTAPKAPARVRSKATDAPEATEQESDAS